ncbi:hypothetical protein Z517_04053 [Fonsecaea pedrosoi CBS 271.37]|uniref:Uncharacterized protein n=1 Tax=Fonsecaea pedrosoi CBS 271.37 TaxID=1442368 RepID=A0A0D2GR63_9EURO|nr:uncharacterized protein Z517_04053 [Fonsecaea pedrosoi CBS 271.37]KIW81030.1 hypothetical protein Z517_04053 [Fonsecaea pedrosoi CBS 271.37]
MTVPGAPPLGTFSDIAQLSQFWHDPKDSKVLRFRLVDLMSTTDSPRAKVVQTKNPAQYRCHETALLLAYKAMGDSEVTTAYTNVQFFRPPRPSLIDRIKSSLNTLGLTEAAASGIVDGAQTLRLYQRLRDERYQTVEKLQKALERVTEEVAEMSKSYESPKAWEIPHLTLNNSKVLVVEEEVLACERVDEDQSDQKSPFTDGQDRRTGQTDRTDGQDRRTAQGLYVMRNSAWAVE